MKKRIVLKSIKVVVIVSLLSVFGLTSCSKDDETASPAATITDEEAVEVIENSLAKDSGGMAKTVETTIETAVQESMYTDQPTVECGQLYTDSYSEDFSNGNYSYNYAITRDYILTCVNGSPESLTYDLDFSGVYDTPRMSSNDSTTLDWQVSNLGATETSSTFSGSYLREGTQVSKVFNMNTFESTLTYTLSNLVVDKNTYQILSGSAQVSFLAESSNGNTYSFSGSLTFNGNNTATLILNGNTYTIHL